MFSTEFACLGCRPATTATDGGAPPIWCKFTQIHNIQHEKHTRIHGEFTPIVQNRGLHLRLRGETIISPLVRNREQCRISCSHQRGWSWRENPNASKLGRESGPTHGSPWTTYHLSVTSTRFEADRTRTTLGSAVVSPRKIVHVGAIW